MQRWWFFPLLAASLVVFGCSRHHVTADMTHKVEIAPIQVTVDVNLKVQKALDEALDFQGDMQDVFSEEELQQLE
jgi:hypothetical protein